MPDVAAVIVARSRDESGEQPDLLELRARSLVMHSVEHALRSEEVDHVIVSVDDPHVADRVRGIGVATHRRVEREIAGERQLGRLVGDACAERGDLPDIVVVLDPSMPLRRPTDVDDAVRQLMQSGKDCVIGAVVERGDVWISDGEAATDSRESRWHRLETGTGRRFRATGSILAARVEALATLDDPSSADCGIHVMERWSAFQIHNAADLRIASWIMDHDAHFVRWPQALELIVFDFDGVMTENGALVDEYGNESVRVNRGDGWGIARVKEAGIPMVVMSTEANPVVQRRCEKLGIECVQNVVDKRQALSDLLASRCASAENVAFVGNDVNDLGALQMVGLPVVVADAHPMTISAASLVLRLHGGHGAVREFCDLVLERYG